MKTFQNFQVSLRKKERKEGEGRKAGRQAGRKEGLPKSGACSACNCILIHASEVDLRYELHVCGMETEVRALNGPIKTEYIEPKNYI